MDTIYTIIATSILVIFLFISFGYIYTKIDKLEMEIRELKNKEENDFFIIVGAIAKLESRINELEKEIEKCKDNKARK